MLPAQWRSVRVPRPAIAAAAVLLLVIPSLLFVFGLLRTPPALDQGSLGVIRAYAVHDGTTAWTDGQAGKGEDGGDGPALVGGKKIGLGHHTAQLEIPSKALHHVHTNTTVDLDQYLHPLFNLAVLNMPFRSEWDYVGMARVFGMPSDHLQTQGTGMVEEMITIFGLQLRGHELHHVAMPSLLDFPQVPRPCTADGAPDFFGPEDIRLFWTDAGTPAMTFVRGSSSPDPRACRSTALVDDLRLVYPELHEATRWTDIAPVRPFELGGILDRELVRLDGEVLPAEKNWAAFYPGAVPDKQTTTPHISYSIAPAKLLQVTGASSRRIFYEQIHSRTLAEGLECINTVHPFTKNRVIHSTSWKGDQTHFSALHHATPWHRLTLCLRGCKPTDMNTVFIALNHVKLGGHAYARFFVLRSVVAPFEIISVGPLFDINGADNGSAEEERVLFILSLVPYRPATGWNLKKQADDLDKYDPGHLYIDDEMLVSFGWGDNSMWTTVIPVLDAISSHRLCQE